VRQPNKSLWNDQSLTVQPGAAPETQSHGGKMESCGGKFLVKFCDAKRRTRVREAHEQIGWGSRGALKRPWPRRRRIFLYIRCLNRLKMAQKYDVSERNFN
jgi:hypothetical protein